MRRPFPAAARLRVIALITPVLLAAFGTSGAASGAASAAPCHQQPRPTALATVTKVRWHALRLVDGWKSARSKSYAVANPQYAISGGVVYLDGSLHQTSGTRDEFAVLPLAARPARNVILAVLSGSGSGSRHAGDQADRRHDRLVARWQHATADSSSVRFLPCGRRALECRSRQQARN